MPVIIILMAPEINNVSLDFTFSLNLSAKRWQTTGDLYDRPKLEFEDPWVRRKDYHILV